MEMWHSLDAGWGMATVRAVMGLIFVGAGWSKAAGGVLSFFAGSGRLSIDEAWLERQPA